jgi:hypothetical protein
MAITTGDRMVWRELRKKDLIPHQPSVLEIGRANWYGDMPPATFHIDRKEFSESGDDWMPKKFGPWEIADWYYRFMLRQPKRHAIDLDENAGEEAWKLDLNNPLPQGFGEDFFDLIINTGTTEHVFNQKQVWETIHDACKVGGLMVHAMPLWGWLDHGFYNYHPTFVCDVAAENGYEIVSWWAANLSGFAVPVGTGFQWADLQRQMGGESMMMHVAFRKTKAEPFRVPMQGVYSSRSTPQAVQNWQENR